MVVVLSRGGFCPKDRRQAEGLVQLHREMEVGYCRLVTITTDNITQTNEYRSGAGAHWPFLSDSRRIVQKEPPDLVISDETMEGYGAFGLACIAGVMYLVQERQLKTHQLHSIFYHLPPLTDLFAAITRLLWWGFLLYTLGLVSGFFTGRPLPRIQVVAAIGIWVLYAAILQGRHLHRLAPKRVATLCIFGFTAALTLLWGISFSAQTHSLP